MPTSAERHRSRRRLRRRPRVALLVETSNAYARGVLQGVVRYTEQHPWSLQVLEQGRGDDPPRWLEQWDGDGIIARIETLSIAQAVLRKRLPTVDVSAARLAPSLPWVETDDQQIAKLAAEHLIERGFRQFAFCADTRFNWSRWREMHFSQYVRAAGFQCHTYAPRKTIKSMNALRAGLGRWLKSLPKPVGVFACYDVRGQQVLDACRDVSLGVPEEVAVIGVDNDELLCHLAAPPLSSVIPNTLQTGYEAAALLDQMMAGRKIPPSAHLIAPRGIAERQSTDILAVEDRDIARALQFIREHACEGINVSDVLRTGALSRRVFEQRFQRLLGHTPRYEILRVRLRRVKQLVSDTDLPFHKIAERTGFKHAEYLSVIFKRETGKTLSRYRIEARC